MTTAAAEQCDTKTAELEISGMTCAGCVRSIERALQSVPGVARADVNLATGTASVDYEASQADLVAIRQAVERAGYGARESVPETREEPGAEQEREAAAWKGKFIVAAVFTTPLLVIAMSHGALAFPGSHWLQLGLALPVVLYSGRQFFALAWKGLMAALGGHEHADRSGYGSCVPLFAGRDSGADVDRSPSGDARGCSCLLRNRCRNHHADSARPLARSQGAARNIVRDSRPA